MKIMMIGPHLKVKGGISSLEKMIMENYNEPGVKLEMAPSMNDFWILGRITHFFVLIFSLPLRFLFNKPDLVHIHFSHSMSTWRKQILLRLWKLLRVPVIMHSHSSQFAQFYPKLPKFLQYFVSKGLQKADRMIVLSESWKEFYVSKCGVNPSNIFILPTPSLLPNLSDIKNNSNNLVLFSGRIGERKGTFDLINAWSKLPESILSVSKLIITGDGKINEAKKLVNKLSLNSSVRVTGWLPEYEFKKYLEDCSIYVLPSNNEGLPMGLIEAMAYQKAVITTPVGGIPELIINGNNGLLVNPGDINELSKAIEKLIINKELRQVLASNARISVEPMGFKNYSNKILSIWKGTINSAK